ncbi:protein kinase domain-containing protein [Dokdonella sp.]|uniref:serine/threonine protein kinase n=1 Tax=Dokdonella sp. TaxID=2291710 RepID=UPI003C30F4B8
MSNSSVPEGKTLAERICDGEPIQWPASIEAPESNRRAALQLLDTISRTYRSNRQDAPDCSNGETWGPLRLLGPLGEGSFGTVYRALDPLLQREVALKLARVDGSRARQWISEARRLSRISHPNVVAIHGAEIHEGRAGIWFERIEGQSLQQWIVQQGPLGSGELIAVGESLCAALAAVHGAGLIHGDIKPANILREIGGRIVLLDFGSSRELGAESLATGSLPYLAPELLEGGSPSIATDVYALGMTLRYLLVGQLPDAADAGQRLLDRRPDLPQALVGCVEAACSADPGRRPRSAGVFSTGLTAAGSASIANAMPVVARNPATWMIAACLILAMMAWAGWRAFSSSPAMLKDVALMTRDSAGAAQPVQRPLQIGAPLSLRLAPNREIFVYVLNQDDRGNRHLLYPLTPDQNPIRSHDTVELPGQVNGQRVDWQVDSSSSEERFAVIASAERLHQLESSLANWPRAGQSSTHRDQRLRGVGGLANAPEGPALDLDSLVSPYQNREDVEVVLLRLPAE